MKARATVVMTGLLLQVAAALAAETLWLDVRSPEEFAQGHLPGARNVPYMEVGVAVPRMATDKDTDIRVYCGVGVRAEIARLQLQAAGYRNVVNEGGYADLAQRLAKGGKPPCSTVPGKTNPEEESC